MSDLLETSDIQAEAPKISLVSSCRDEQRANLDLKTFRNKDCRMYHKLKFTTGSEGGIQVVVRENMTDASEDVEAMAQCVVGLLKDCKRDELTAEFFLFLLEVSTCNSLILANNMWIDYCLVATGIISSAELHCDLQRLCYTKLLCRPYASSS